MLQSFMMGSAGHLHTLYYINILLKWEQCYKKICSHCGDVCPMASPIVTRMKRESPEPSLHFLTDLQSSTKVWNKNLPFTTTGSIIEETKGHGAWMTAAAPAFYWLLQGIDPSTTIFWHGSVIFWIIIKGVIPQNEVMLCPQDGA